MSKMKKRDTRFCEILGLCLSISLIVIDKDIIIYTTLDTINKSLILGDNQGGRSANMYKRYEGDRRRAKDSKEIYEYSKYIYGRYIGQIYVVILPLKLELVD